MPSILVVNEALNYQNIIQLLNVTWLCPFLPLPVSKALQHLCQRCSLQTTWSIISTVTKSPSWSQSPPPHIWLQYLYVQPKSLSCCSLFQPACWKAHTWISHGTLKLDPSSSCQAASSLSAEGTFSTLLPCYHYVDMSCCFHLEAVRRPKGLEWGGWKSDELPV